MIYNDKNQLCIEDYTLPTYAQSNIWLCSGNDAIQTHGAPGDFSQITVDQRIDMRWGSSDGPILSSFQPQDEVLNLNWDGTVALGGYVDAVHVMTFDELAISVYFLAAQPIKQDFQAFPTAKQRHLTPYQGADFHLGLITEVPETLTTWLVANDSPLDAIMENALVNNLRVYCFGALADTESGWGDLIALPLTLEAVTLFAP